ncbi:Pollen receptor-like kinase 3 [Dionaea muscipula]
MSAVRFLLLLLCLSLSPPSSFSSTPPAADSDVTLLSFKKSLSSNTSALDSWQPNSHPCKDRWAGVFCDQGKGTIIRLHLTGMGLSGDINIDALRNLTSLLSISITNNSFSGPLPPFNKLPGLKALYLSRNDFSGDIPPDFFSGMAVRRLFLSFNRFSGRIPDSLANVSTLQQLHLENNEFSGPIPDISQKSLTELDLSNNKLEGEVPASMSRFGPNAFEGNAGVCGKPLATDCQPKDHPFHDQSGDTSNNSLQVHGNNKTAVGVLVGILAVMLALFILTTAIKSRHNADDFRMLEKDPMDDVVEVRVQGQGPGGGGGGGGGSRKSMDGSSRKKEENSSTKKGAQGGAGAKGTGMGDLVVINNEKGVFGLADLMKAAAEVLGNGGLGSAYKAMMGDGVSVVVKRIRDMNKLGKEEFDAEIRKIGSIRHPNILTPLAYHYRKEEKLLVSEYIPKGSLLYVLHGIYLSIHLLFTVVRFLCLLLSFCLSIFGF